MNYSERRKILMADKFNYEQNLALENPIEIDLQVSAGAGSGKTKTLSEKVMRLIEQGLKPSELLVLTFTNNAAHEMKERIIDKFKDRKDIAIELASAHIQTFDSFSQYLVSMYSGQLKLAEQVGIVNEDVIETKKQEYINAVLDEYYLDSAKKEALLRTLIKFNLRDDEVSKRVISDLVTQISKLSPLEQDQFLNKYDETFLTREPFDRNIELLLDKAKQIIKDEIFYAYFFEKHFDEIDSVDFLTLKDTFKNVNNFNKDVTKLVFEDEELTDPLYHAYLSLLPLKGEQFITAIKNFLVVNKDLYVNKKPTTYDGRKAYAAYLILNKIISSAQSSKLNFISSLGDLNVEYQKITYFKDDIHLYLDIVKEVLRRLNDYKKTTNSFTFSDISYMALSLMTDPQYQDIADEIRSRFKFIMVDEYQDNNDLQEIFIESLLKENKKDERSHLFCVGDAKQSIYAFRDSNVELFRNRQRRYELLNGNGAKAIPMNKNYRSGKQLLMDINHIFNFYMTINHGGVAYHKQSESLQYDDEINLYNKPYDDFGVYRITSVSTVNNDNAPYGAKEWEARAIAQDIKDKVKNKYQVSVRSRQGNILRDANYGDFCILVGVKSCTDLYQKVFQEYGIPLNCKIKKDLNEMDVITVIKSLIGLIDYVVNNKPSDTTFAHLFASVARSYLYEYTDQQLFDLLNDPSHEYVLVSHDPIIMQITDFINKYKDSSFSVIFIELLSEFKVIEKLYKIGDVDDALTKIESLYQIALSEQKAGEGISEFVVLMDNIKKYQTKLSSESLYQVEDAVDLMTIHGSKGLERKIVYMPCSFNYIASGGNDSKPDYVFSKKYGILLPYYNYQFTNCDLSEIKNYFSTQTIANVIYTQANDERKIEEDEHVRLFYVALTRAENSVYIVGDMPSLTSKEIEKQRKKDRPYGMLMHTPYYILLNDTFIKDKISQGIVNQEDYDLYLKYVGYIKTISRDITNDDLKEDEYNRYSTLWKDYYLTLVSNKIIEYVNNIEINIYKDYLNKFVSVSNYDDLAYFFSIYFYGDDSIKTVKDLLEYKPLIRDKDDDDSDNFDFVITEETVVPTLDEFKDAIINLKKESILNIALNNEDMKQVGKGNIPTKVLDALLLPFAQYFDHQIQVKSISFKVDDYLDKTYVFDYKKHPINKKSYIAPKLPVLKVDTNEITFKQREHLQASKKTTDEELPSQEFLDYGTYLHRLLELVDFKSKDTSFIKNEKDRRIIDKVLSLGIFSNLDNAVIYQEYGYYDDELLSTGFIDLLIVKDDKYYIIDYKAKHIYDEAYVNQLHTYRRNICNIFNIKDTTKVQMYLLSILDCKIIKVE